MSNEFERRGKKATVSSFEVLYWVLSGVTEDSHEYHCSGYSVYWPACMLQSTKNKV